ncbi:MAG: type I-E CRISPR-associated protein Cse1/CasA [Chlorobium phaeovibrioides]|nr:type I-E CRISPR-associated protein Cse1/CasA [Chlorobium phaeovibrioides]
MNTVHTVSGQQRFNLVDEPWIPVVSKGLLSLRQVFSEPDNPALGGNPIQKIALTKLLLAIGQAACTPTDIAALNALDAIAFRSACLTYLDKWHDRFWLYGEKPFLQMPAVEKLIEERKQQELKAATKPAAKLKAEENAMPRPIGMGFYPDMPAENNTILTQHQTAETVEDAAKALFVVTLMNFAFAGKRIEKNLDPLSNGFTGKTGSAKPGPSIGNYVGYLHSFLAGSSVLDSLMLNILSHEQINAHPYWKSGLGIPPWEDMPNGEDCPAATALKGSYMATLVSLSRFVLLKGDGIHYVEGLQYPSHKDGWIEPSMLVKPDEKGPKVSWADPNRRPWRELPAMLSFLDSQTPGGYECLFIKDGLKRAKARHHEIGIWSGGLRVSTNSGDQSVKQDNDFVESCFFFDANAIDTLWYEQFQKEMEQLEQLSRWIYSATRGYYDKQNMDGSNFASHASGLFWQLSEHHFLNLVNACEKIELIADMRKKMAALALQAFDAFCPKDTARQIDAWASSRPNLSKYLFNN